MCGAALKIRAGAGSAWIWIALMALLHIPPSHSLRVAGLLVPLTVVSAGWDQTVARSPRNGPPKRVIHGPNYRPPYAAIVVDDKSGFVLHEVNADGSFRIQPRVIRSPRRETHRCRSPRWDLKCCA